MITGKGTFQLFAPLQNLKDQIKVFTTLAFVEVYGVLDDRGSDALKSGAAVCFHNNILQEITDLGFLWKVIPGSLDWCSFHN